MLVVRTNFSLTTYFVRTVCDDLAPREHHIMTELQRRVAALFLNRVGGRPLFDLGRIYATPGATALLESLDLKPNEFIFRHLHGDWGDLDEEDQQANQAALLYGTRLLSAYVIGSNQKLWIITEADRSATALLLPEEY